MNSAYDPKSHSGARKRDTNLVAEQSGSFSPKGVVLSGYNGLILREAYPGFDVHEIFEADFASPADFFAMRL